MFFTDIISIATLVIKYISQVGIKYRVPTGPGNLEKSWNFKIRFKGLEKSWNSVTLYKGPLIQSMVLEYFTF